MRKLSIAILATLAIAGTVQASERLQSDDIKSDIIGRQIFLATPFGGEFPLNYHPSGQVDGNGKALGIGRLVKPEDKGRWWIEADKLCQKFQTWYDGAPMCFELYRTSNTSVKWIRNNGETGTARIGSRL